MNKYLALTLSIVIIICAIILSNLYAIRENQGRIYKFNLKYEQYIEKTIFGRDIATIINQAVNDNENNMIQKDSNKMYIQDDEKSVYIDVVITEFKEPKTYSMETLYNGGMSEFVKYYGQIFFECRNYEYNSKGQIKHLTFEQVIKDK